MSMNKLKLNSVKTEFFLIGNEQQWSKYLSMFPIELLGVKTNPAKSARNLGVIFDKNFTFRSHISVVCSSCFYHMRDLWRIRRHLDQDSAKLLATALVSSCLDYCNSILYGTADIDLTRPHVQNRLARLVTMSPPFTHSIPLFKINMLTYKTLCENSLFIFIPCWLHRFLPVHWDQTMIIVCQSLGSRPILVLELFILVPCLFGTTCHCLPIQSVQLLPTRNIWRHISLIWLFPYRYRHSPWPVNVTELFPQFCC